MTCAQCKGADKLFSGVHVSRELKKYRRKGPRGTTRMLIEALKAEGVEGATLLDIGGGVGAIQHELLRAGADRASGAEAATEYMEAARREAERQGHADRIVFHFGDFVDIADQLEAADIVTLDRVICCYPDVKALVGASIAKARRVYGVVYPRDEWWTKLGSRFLNLFLWLRRNPFRVYIHASRDVDTLARQAGFERRLTRLTPYWQIVLYDR